MDSSKEETEEKKEEEIKEDFTELMEKMDRLLKGYYYIGKEKDK